MGILPGIDEEAPRLFVAGSAGPAEEVITDTLSPESESESESVTGAPDPQLPAADADGEAAGEEARPSRRNRWLVGGLAAAISGLIAVALVAAAGPDPVRITKPRPVVVQPEVATTTIPEMPEDRALFAAVDACPTVRTGSVPDHLGVGELLARTSKHPVRAEPAKWVGPFMFAAPGAKLDKRPPFAIVAVLSGPGATARDTGSEIDRIGSTQLWSTWDGTTLRSAVRRWDGRRWYLTPDDPSLLVEYFGQAIRFFYDGLQPGDRLGIVTASEGNCQASAVGEDLLPLDIAVVGP